MGRLGLGLAGAGAGTGRPGLGLRLTVHILFLGQCLLQLIEFH